MSRDFAKNKAKSSTKSNSAKSDSTKNNNGQRSRTPLTGGKDKPNKKRATNRRKPSSASSSTRSLKHPPLWAWFVVIGCLIAFGWFLTKLAKTEPSTTNNKKPEPSITEEKNADASSQVKFDFYKILKGKEVNVDERIIEKTPEKKNIIYFLQAGSFKDAGDADTLRAKLILQGLPVEVQQTTGKNNQQWHRVIAGPFDNRSALAKARSILASNAINSIVIKREK